MGNQAARDSGEQQTPPSGRDPLRPLSPTLFGVILLCFLLPFLTVNCYEQPVTITGIQAATGIDLPGSDPRSEAELLEGETVPNGFALLALASALAGLGFGFVRDKKGILASGAAGALGVIALEAFGMFALARTQYGTGLTPRFGYPLTVLLFLLALGLNDLFIARGSHLASGLVDKQRSAGQSRRVALWFGIPLALVSLLLLIPTWFALGMVLAFFLAMGGLFYLAARS